RGHELVAARKRLDPDSIRREIDATKRNAEQPWAEGSTMARTLESLQAQLATVERFERVIADADSRLRLLNARLDEAAARTIELSVQASDASQLGGLGDDVDQMVDEMEALRLAIEETGAGARRGRAGRGRGPPRGGGRTPPPPCRPRPRPAPHAAPGP